LRNAVLLAVLLSAVSVLAVAQSAAPTPDTQQAQNIPWDQTSYTGCLQSSRGKFTLVEEDGTSHELVGSTGKLKHEVGHEVEVIGKNSTRSVDRTPVGGASNVIEYPVVEVKSVRQVASKCKSAD